MGSFFMYIKQIKPLENGDYESVPKSPGSTSNNVIYKPIKSKNLSASLCERGFGVFFNVYQTNQTLGKRGL